MEARYHGWSLFWGACLLAVGGYVFSITSHRVPRDRLGMALGVAALLAGARFVFGAVTGRIPRWMVTFIDAEK